MRYLIIGFGVLMGLCGCSQAGRVEPAHASAATPLENSLRVETAPPVAPVRPVSDSYFGTTIVDPYRWMESSSPELDAWMKGQANFAERTLAALPSRGPLRERVRALADTGVQARYAERRGSQLFYLKRTAGEETYKLYVAGLDATNESRLVDPTEKNSGTDTYSIDYFEPSPDGRFVAYGLSPNGSEMAVIHVVETNTGRELPEVIDRARWAGPSWTPDSQAFFYKRDRALAKDAPESERMIKSPVFLHRLGSSVEYDDVAVFGYGVSPQIDVPAEGWSNVWSPNDGDYLFASVSEGVRPEVTLYTVRRDQLAGARTPWRKIVDMKDGVVDFDSRGDRLYLISHQAAPRFKLLGMKLSERGPFDLSQAQVLLPESQAVIRRLAVAKDALYVQLLDGGLSRVQRITHGADEPSELPLPIAGTVRQMTATVDVPGVLFQLTSWTLAPRLFHFDPETNIARDTGVIPASKVDFSQVDASEVKAVAADGTSIPLSIIARRDLAKEQTHPTLLHAYGAYGNTAEPYFDPMLLAWLERGGVYAVCHPRGGGEYGDAWHVAGKLEHKPNTITDTLACADELVERKLTSPAQLAIEGESAGGIPAGNALVRRAAQLGAVVIRVGMVNALRFEQIPIGPMNTIEFGTVQTEDGFQMLRAIDAYHQVRERGAYPAVLLTTGITDPRVSPWQAAKLAARLQASSTSGRPVLLRIDYGAGHGWGSTKSSDVDVVADEYAFLFSQLGPAAPR